MEPIKMVFHAEDWELGLKCRKKIIIQERGFGQINDASVP